LNIEKVDFCKTYPLLDSKEYKDTLENFVIAWSDNVFEEKAKISRKNFIHTMECNKPWEEATLKLKPQFIFDPQQVRKVWERVICITADETNDDQPFSGDQLHF
jgi:hypothetical protein